MVSLILNLNLHICWFFLFCSDVEMCLLKYKLQEKDEQIDNMRRQLETRHNSGETSHFLYFPFSMSQLNDYFHRHFSIRILHQEFYY